MIFSNFFVDFKGSISDPLDYQKALERAAENQTQSSGELCPSGNCSDLSDEDLKTKDTDGDGLWDDDEFLVVQPGQRVRARYDERIVESESLSRESCDAPPRRPAANPGDANLPG